MISVLRFGALALLASGLVAVTPAAAQDEVVIGYSAPGLVGAQL
jgi:hypothetical protein